MGHPFKKNAQKYFFQGLKKAMEKNVYKVTKSIVILSTENRQNMQNMFLKVVVEGGTKLFGLIYLGLQAVSLV